MRKYFEHVVGGLVDVILCSHASTHIRLPAVRLYSKTLLFLLLCLPPLILLLRNIEILPWPFVWE